MRIEQNIEFGILQIEGNNGYKVSHVFTATPETVEDLKNWFVRFKEFNKSIHENSPEVVGGMFQYALDALCYHFAKHSEMIHMEPCPAEYLNDADMTALYSKVFGFDKRDEDGESLFVDIFNNARIFYDYVIAGPGCKVEYFINSKNPGDGKDCIFFSDYNSSLERKNRMIDQGEIELMEDEKTSWSLFKPSRIEKFYQKSFTKFENEEAIEKGRQMLLVTLDPEFTEGLK